MADGVQAGSTADSDNPVLVEVTRGELVESRHRAGLAVVDASAGVVYALGDIKRPIYARSAIKPLQALALVESGAAEAYDCSETELALACASHEGETNHVETARAWLARIGLSEGDLECGAHLPYSQEAAAELLRTGSEPTPAHNNCSGKHAGFLTVACHLNVPTQGYVHWDHPVQQRVLGVLEMMTGLDLRAAPRGIDGCGIPVIAVPLGNLALAMARFVAPHDQPEHRQQACSRVRTAMARHPFMVAGSGRFCTKVISATRGKALIKVGAEGVYCAGLPELGLGVALKVDDGARRAAEVIMGQLLERLGQLDTHAATALAEDLRPILRNRAGREIGCIRPVSEWPV